MVRLTDLHPVEFDHLGKRAAQMGLRKTLFRSKLDRDRGFVNRAYGGICEHYLGSADVDL